MARRTFTAEFREAAVRLVTEQHYGVREASRSLAVGVSTLRSWIRRSRGGPSGRRSWAGQRGSAIVADWQLAREERDPRRAWMPCHAVATSSLSGCGTGVARVPGVSSPSLLHAPAIYDQAFGLLCSVGACEHDGGAPAAEPLSSPTALSSPRRRPWRRG
jgi:transposase-like protein